MGDEQAFVRDRLTPWYARRWHGQRAACGPGVRSGRRAELAWLWRSGRGHGLLYWKVVGRVHQVQPAFIGQRRHVSGRLDASPDQVGGDDLGDQPGREIHHPKRRTPGQGPSPADRKGRAGPGLNAVLPACGAGDHSITTGTVVLPGGGIHSAFRVQQGKRCCFARGRAAPSGWTGGWISGALPWGDM